LIESVRMWGRLEDELDADLEVAMPGGLIVAETDAQMRDIERKVSIERSQGMRIDLLGRTELAKIASYVSKRMIGGAYSAEEGKANPLKVTPAFARAAIRHGATIETFTRVLGIEEESDGFNVTTNRERIRTHRIIDCAGADAGLIARMIGIELPIDGHAIQVSVTEPIQPLVKHLLYFAGGRLTLKQTANGTLLIGGGWPARRVGAMGHLAVDPLSLRNNLNIAARVVPAITTLNVVRTWPAIVNGTDDWKPILGEMPGHPRFFMNMFPWLGFSAGPVAARLVADLVLGHKPAFDLSAFSALRYGK
jgi:glycine/D-amino acid oxidase-like deaminating enzyme